MGAPPMRRGLASTLGRASGPSVDGIMPRLQRIGTSSPPPKAVARVSKKIRKVWDTPTASGSGSLTIQYNLSDVLGGSSEALWDITVSATAGGLVTGTQDVTVFATAGPNGNARTESLISGVPPTTAQASAFCLGSVTSSVSATVAALDVSGLTITLIMDASRR